MELMKSDETETGTVRVTLNTDEVMIAFFIAVQIYEPHLTKDEAVAKAVTLIESYMEKDDEDGVQP